VPKDSAAIEEDDDDEEDDAAVVTAADAVAAALLQKKVHTRKNWSAFADPGRMRAAMSCWMSSSTPLTSWENDDEEEEEEERTAKLRNSE